MLVTSSIWLGLSFGFNGLMLWLPEFFKRQGVAEDVNIYEASFYVNLATLPGWREGIGK
jgi:hypothetical protein